MISSCSSLDSASSYDILDRADVANAFVANSIPQSAMHLKVVVSLALGRRLLMIVSCFNGTSHRNPARYILAL